MTVEEVLEAAGVGGVGEALGRYVTEQRWFGGHGRDVAAIRIIDAGTLRRADPAVLHVVVRAEYRGGGGDVYNVPIGVTPLPATIHGPVIDRVVTEDGELIVHDALHTGAGALALWTALAAGRDVPTCAGHLTMSAGGLRARSRRPEEIRLVGGEQSNTALCWRESEFLKFIRRVETGPSVELEMARALDLGGFRHHAPVLASIEYHRSGDEAPSPVAVVQPFVAGARDGWSLAREALAVTDEGRSGARGLPLVDELEDLGAVTAEMHLALASPQLPPGLAAGPVTPGDLAGWASEMIDHLAATAAAGGDGATELAELSGRIRADVDAIRGLDAAGLATRIHGDYHLGQVVLADGRWSVLDFEGEPRRLPAQRRARYSPLRDVAGMLRSFDYAASTEDRPGRDHWRRWVEAATEGFWSAYRRRVAGSRLIPEDTRAALTLRRAFEIDKAVYEIDYERAHRPSWVSIPLRFLRSRYH